MASGRARQEGDLRQRAVGKRGWAGPLLCALPLLVLCLLPLPSAWADASQPTRLDERQARLFSQACAHCHLRPDIQVPVLGIDADWKKRRARGFDSMLANTINGFGDMPPLGTCGACSEVDFRALVSFLALIPETPSAQPAAREEGEGMAR